MSKKQKKIERIIPAKIPVYLEGPKHPVYEFGFAFHVFREFIKAFRTLHFVGHVLLFLVVPVSMNFIRTIYKLLNLANA